ncbi:hypothetical protein [Micromonospora aurantiaca (nom. illeg.)]|uniref:hypothetical protein n=1 Tax=Micromonospora aurantiaca (nom. illeg.) TaxID=47850 RepID=UPI0011AAD731|nr:hypothetical protein [Micromonospora aurantiaca]MBC9000511.1 hypothetical protein [Micromonospora aurantiaca]
MTWRYIARRAVTGEILDWDLPLHRDELTWGLRRSGSLRGSIDPDIGQLRAPDGRLLLEEWGTELFAEADGHLRWGGIIVSSRFSGSQWSIEAAGVSAYPRGIPYLGEYSRVGVDPLDAAREIWAHLQSFPNGDLGVVLDGTKSPARLGKPGVAAFEEVFLGGKWVRKDAVPASSVEPSASAKLKTGIDSNDSSLTLAAMGLYDQLAPPYLITVGAETMRVTGRTGTKLTGLERGYGTSSATSHREGTLVKHDGTQTRTVAAQPAEPYLLAWWDAKDCGGEFEQLANQTPFDWAEDVAWGAGGSIVHRIRLGYPRLGRRRDDLAFVQGDNVVSAVPVQVDGDDYANEVFGLGAGEGRTLVHTRLPIIDGRLRRVAVVSNKAVTSGSRLDMICRDELIRRRGLVEITEIEVVDHPNARIGSWAVGDDILVQARVPWLGDVPLWSRVIGWSLIGEHRAKLALQRADRYTYGSVA